MILWLTVVGLAILIATASWWMVRRWDPLARRERRDRDWGDWPSDQMGP